MRLVAVALAVLALTQASCSRRKRNKGSIDRAAAKALFEEVPVATPPGISDVTADERGVLWAVAEREPTIVEIELGKPPIAHRIEGVPAGVDTEAVQSLGGGKFAFGYEGTLGPAAGVLFAERRGDAIVVTGMQKLADKDLDLSITINHGIEALCGKDGELLAASESIGKLPDGRRWAAIVRMRPEGNHLTRLWLTSKRGKISGMQCTIADDGVAQVTAIERHFGVVRILRFTLSRDDKDITPTLDMDLFPVLHDNFNFEGVTRLPDGRLVLVNDNQYDTIDGPTELFIFRPR
jgi:hypothetical protein